MPIGASRETRHDEHVRLACLEAFCSVPKQADDPHSFASTYSSSGEMMEILSVRHENSSVSCIMLYIKMDASTLGDGADRCGVTPIAFLLLSFLNMVLSYRLRRQRNGSQFFSLILGSKQRTAGHFSSTASGSKRQGTAGGFSASF